MNVAILASWRSCEARATYSSLERSRVVTVGSAVVPGAVAVAIRLLSLVVFRRTLPTPE
jgi:hypothetical protein